MPPMVPNPKHIRSFTAGAAFAAWMKANHARADEIWIKVHRKDSGLPSITCAEALDVALCYGWIDGQKGRYDETHWLQRFTPRRPRSKWSQTNRDKVEALVSAGRMRPCGQAQVDAAKADGRWAAAYAGQKSATVPDDLADALAADPQAKAFFETLSGANRFAILYRVHDAKKPQTRAARIAKFVEMCHDHETLH
jgi:uncharacterized protein YdeI (YjbR/CyaY-like superfamily)